jgi:hypothetical protein
MPDLVRLLDQAVLFGLGAATIPLADWLQTNTDWYTELPYAWQAGGPFIALGVACCFLEALAIRQTGHHRWFGSWLPAVLGLIATFIVLVRYGPHGPDSGEAIGMAITSFVVGVPIFAVVVNVMAAVAARLWSLWR